MNSQPVTLAKNGRIDWPENRPAALTLSFDNGFLGSIQASLPVLAEYGAKASYNIITAMTGAQFESLPTASWETLMNVWGQGHELACHSDHHRPMANWSSEAGKLWAGLANSPQPLVFLQHIWRTARALQTKHQPAPRPGPRNNLKASRLEMEQRLPGLQVQSFVYPAGRFNRASQREAAEAGFFSARTALPGTNRASTSPFALRALVWSPGTRISEVIPWLDLATRRHEWLIIVFHEVGVQNSSGYPFFCSLQDFQGLLEQARKRNLWITTQAEAARYVYQENRERRQPA